MKNDVGYIGALHYLATRRYSQYHFHHIIKMFLQVWCDLDMALQLFAGGKKCLNFLGFCVNFPGKYNHFFCIIVSTVGG